MKAFEKRLAAVVTATPSTADEIVKRLYATTSQEDRDGRISIALLLGVEKTLEEWSNDEKVEEEYVDPGASSMRILYSLKKDRSSDADGPSDAAQAT